MEWFTKSRWLLGVLMAGAIGLSGCISMQKTEKKESPGWAPPPPLAIEAGSRSTKYTFQPGDTLSVSFFYHPRFNTSVKVRPDGYISMAPVDEILASGLTVPELDNALTSASAKWLENPDLSVSVTDYVHQNVYVGGEVNRAGLHPLSFGMTAFDALVQAGGSRNTGNLKHVIIIRRGTQGDREMFALNLAEQLKTGQAANDISLHPFDVVYVPQTKIAKANQFVNQYIEQLLPVKLVGTAGFSYIKQSDSNQKVQFEPLNISLP